METAHWARYVFLVVVLSVILLGVARSVRRGRASSGQRVTIEAQREIFRTPVAARYRTQRGAWSVLTLRFMELIVRQSSLQITPRWPRATLSRYMEGQGRQWFLTAGSTRMRAINLPIPRIRRRQGPFIVLAQMRSNGDQFDLVAIATANLLEAWRALERCGVTGDSPPPIS